MDYQWDNHLIEDDDFDSSDEKYPRGRPIIELPVDLTRKEFVTFNTIVSKSSGNQRYSGRFSALMVIIFAITVLMFIYDILVHQSVDYISLIFLFLWVVTSLSIRLFMPNAARRSAEKVYDKTILSGHSYYGMLHIFNDHIEKISENNEVSLSFRDNIFYFENELLIGVMISGKPAIIIPARCITQDDLLKIKRVLLPAIPLPKQYISGEIIPLASEHIKKQESETDDGWEFDDVYRITVSYTKEELNTYNGNLVFMNFIKRLPFYGVLAFLAALMAIFNGDFIVGILFFVGVILGILILQVVIGKVRASSLFKRMEESGDFMVFEISPIGIIIKGTWVEENINGITWESVKRAINGDTFIDFHTETGFISIPKRCILDFEKFENIVDKFYVNKNAV